MYQSFEKAKSDIIDLEFGYSIVKDGNMGFAQGDYDTVCCNRLNFVEKIGLDNKKIFCFNAEHADNIFLLNSLINKQLLTKSNEVLGYGFDAVVTRLTDVCIVLTFADCVPLVVYDKVNRVMGYCHLGRKPTTLGLLPKVLDTMIKSHNCKVQNLVCIMGPSIFASSYHFPQVVQKSMPGWDGFVVPVGNEWGLDIRGYLLSQLENHGIRSHQIYVEERDTCVDPDFFSYYRSVSLKQGNEGRFIFYAMIR